MQVMLMIWETPAMQADPSKPETDPAGPVWRAYTEALVAAGAMRGGNALAPAKTALTLRVRDGARALHDGPYADTKESFGGYYLLEVPDMAAALDWAARCPAAATGAVELRQVLTT